jgi:sulfatase maturation enzyme AslB (radical SAM superfamily)
MSDDALVTLRARGPEVPFRWLETLWFQVTGTLCNIACRHCFISCGPKADRVPMMTVAQVQAGLEQGQALGMKQVYFTGGEPFLHPELPALAAMALAAAPLTIVTNGILIDDAAVGWLKALFERSMYSLDLRVSLDGMTAAQNDPVRGRGTFEQIVAAIQRLGRAGLSPVVTVVEHEEAMGAAAARTRFLEFVRELGVRQPRVKFLPLLRIGREERRTRGYGPGEALGEAPLLPEVESSLLCATGRVVTATGVFTCPILIEHESARLGATVGDGARPLRLGWSACQTCVHDGLRCNT